MLNCVQSIPIDILLNRPVVFELSRLGNDDEKNFVMALLFVRLYEATLNNPQDGKLRHLTLIEEANRLVGNIKSSSYSFEAPTPRDRIVNTFIDMLSEMRIHGESIIISDQMPGRIVPEVLKRTSLKIIHRILAHDDRQSIGNVAGLTSEQIDYLPHLKVGQAYVHHESLENAQLVQIGNISDQWINNLFEYSRFGELGSLTKTRFDQFKNSNNLQLFY